ncbi:hypothetical protein Mahau_2639 [Mahella australiensis 50-1 BON]|uniref:Uncharacterized protein n=2 Tax=Mahella TaxID=252965 RepID=F3ZYL0_MAHA5|nr:hypothetical protein Mahau_2639 [Mahella australiensis 50-1 BON]
MMSERNRNIENAICDDAGLNKDEAAYIKDCLNAYTAPGLPEGSTANLAAAIGQHMDELYGAPHKRVSIGDILSAAAAQMRFYNVYIWIAALVVLLVGAVWTYDTADIINVNIMVAMVPWLGSGLTLYAMYQRRGVWGELERISTVSSEVAVMGRWVIAIGLDAAAALVATLLSVAMGWESSFAALTLSWLIPLLVSAALSLAVTLRFGISAALITSIMMWSVQLAVGPHLKAFYLIASPGDAYWTASRWIGLILAAALTAWSCFMLRRADREDTPSCE